MAVLFQTLSDILAHGFDTLIDVRSPAEFALDHIPGACNLPVLDDEERARVGKIYVRDNAFSAKKIGAALVARNAARHLEGPLAIRDGAWRPLVYCWRGGQRSGAFATILTQVGWRAGVVAGGYQTYRRLVAAAMYDNPLAHRLVLLDGNTGTAKTELLHMLRARGQQVVDLEALAAHRGSVFGGISQPQPSQKAFEGALAAEFSALDPHRPVLVEAESSKIGKLLIPPSVWQAMNLAPRITVSAPLQARAEYLGRAYGDIVQDRAALDSRLAGLIRHQGREKVAIWQDMAGQGRFSDLARELMQLHYDPSYARARARRPVQSLGEVGMETLLAADLGRAADQISALMETFAADQTRTNGALA